jgi:hypothetical protein
LWEIEPIQTTKSVNEETANQSGYSLSAIPLNSNLSNVVPTVVNNQVINNVMDLGEGVYWISKYNGYFYANTEMIKFDAVEYSVAKPLVASEVLSNTTSGSNVIQTTSKFFRLPKPGQKVKKFFGSGGVPDNTRISSILQTTLNGVTTTVIKLTKNANATGNFVFNIEEETSNAWINSTQEYQDYFSKIPFNGKMYPTGRVRIFAEPYYENYTDSEGFNRVRFKNGAVNKHGRGQFGTKIVEHKAGIEDSYWTDNNNIYGMFMDSDYIFNDKPRKEMTVRVQGNTSNSNTITVISNSGVKAGDSVTGTNIPNNTKIKSISGANTIVIDQNATLVDDDLLYVSGTGTVLRDFLLSGVAAVGVGSGVPGIGGTDASRIAKETVRNGIIKNFLSSSYHTEDDLNAMKTTQPGTVQSSALVMTGSTSTPGFAKPQDFISYIKRDLSKTEVQNPRMFGARMRIIGRMDNNSSKTQTPYGANPVATITSTNADDAKVVSCSSGGIGFGLDPTTNSGYFLEIAALNASNISNFSADDGIINMAFYKTIGKPNALITKYKRTQGSSNIIFYGSNSFKVGDVINIDKDELAIAGINTATDYNVVAATSNDFTLGQVLTSNATATATIVKESTAEFSSKNKTVPFKLWEGLSNILVDDGKFTGQYRLKGETNPTVYDIAVEYEDIVANVDQTKEDKDNKNKNRKETKYTSLPQQQVLGRRFYIYLNGKLVGSVSDNDPPTRIFNNIAPFIRSSSKVMFEKIYAIGQNVANNGVNLEDAPLRGAGSFNNETDSDTAFAKYSTEDSIKETYLSGISPLHQPNYDMYIEEFGTIMREAAYFNFRYDKAYPAFISKIAPTFNRLKGYAVSGFVGNAYGAEFLIFNTTDTVVSLDETTGNYLRILGVTFTQESDRQLTLDDFMKNKSDLSNPDFDSSALESSLSNPKNAAKNSRQIKNSRVAHGKKDFSLASIYIQSADQAEDLMEWIIGKILDPKLSVGLQIFPIPTLQLGDIVTINYKTRGEGNQLVDEVASPTTRFVVYNIEYTRSGAGPSMVIYLSEVT